MGSKVIIKMGSNEGVKYAKSTLQPIRTKGDYYFVICTKPAELRKSKHDKAIRRSTKTKDFREATRLWDKIESEIYREFDAALKRNPFLELAEKYWDKGEYNYTLSKFISSLKANDIIAEVDHNREVNEYLDALDDLGKEQQSYLSSCIMKMGHGYQQTLKKDMVQRRPNIKSVY